ncbi:MAG: glycogen/starch synthase, partial [Baekduiaceae bacterium]
RYTSTMPLRICFLASEVAPLAKTGGLADVAGALTKYLHAAGHDVRLFGAGAWTEPELAAPLHELEERMTTIVHITAGTLFPEESESPDFPALIDATVALIRGLVIAMPITGKEELDARWESMKPILLRAAGDLLDGTRP